MKENDDTQVEKIDDSLKGYSIALCVTGGIAAIETPKIARHLRRYGAEVKAYVTGPAYEFIGKTALEWGTGNKVVDKLSGNAEHICLEDIILVAPATLNTINKIFSGIADNPVTTLIASAMGKKVPIYIAPTMHGSLYDNPILQENLKKAGNYGIRIIEPRIGEGKAKMPHIKSIIGEILLYANGEKDKGEKNGKTA